MSQQGLTLTSTDAADLLRVHASTVKRWSNDGILAFDTTEGGHRRFALDDLNEFARERGIHTVLTPFHPYEPHVWEALREVRDRGSYRAFHALAMGWVHRGKTGRLAELLDALVRSPEVELCQFCDEAIGGLMGRVGAARESGRLRAGDEHAVSQVILETLIKLRVDRAAVRPEGSYAPVAVVGTKEGNLHHMGSMCVRLVLEALGWKVHYLGPDVPLHDFAVTQRGRAAQLLCISMGGATTKEDLDSALEVLSSFYDPSHPYALAFGGAVAEDSSGLELDGPFEDSGVFASCKDFREAVQVGFGATAGVPA